MKENRKHTLLYIVIVVLLVTNVVFLITDFDITNEVTQAAIITLSISTIANIIVTMINSVNNNKNQESNRVNSLKLKELENEDRKESLKLQHELNLEKDKALLDLKLKEQVENKSDLRKEVAISELKLLLVDFLEIKKQYFNKHIEFPDSYYTKEKTTTIIQDTIKYINETKSLITKYSILTKKGDVYYNMIVKKQNLISREKKIHKSTDNKENNKKIVADIYYATIKYLSNEVIGKIQKEIYEITRDYYCVDWLGWICMYKKRISKRGIDESKESYYALFRSIW